MLPRKSLKSRRKSECLRAFRRYTSLLTGQKRENSLFFACYQGNSTVRRTARDAVLIICHGCAHGACQGSSDRECAEIPALFRAVTVGPAVRRKVSGVAGGGSVRN